MSGTRPRRSQAQVRRSAWPGWIWAVPVAAFAMAGWLGVRALMHQGETVTVTFDNAYGMAAALSAQQLHHEIRSGQLVVLDVPLHNTRREIGLTMRAAGTPSPAARALIDAIRLSVVDVTRTVSIGTN